MKGHDSANRWLILGVLFFARTAMGFQFQSVAAVSPLLVRDLAIDFALLGALIGIWMLPGVVVAIPGGLLGQRFGDKRIVVAGLALMALGSFITGAAHDYSVAMLGRVLAGAGAVMLNVLMVKMVADWFHDRELATAMSLLVASWPLGIGLALVVLGPLGSWPSAMQLTAAVCIAALVAVAWVYRTPPQSSAPPVLKLLDRRELSLAVIAGLIWTFYNVAYILVVSFTPVLLASRDSHTGSAAIVTSFATWPLVLSVPLGGYLADRTGRPYTVMVGTFIGMAIAMPFMLAAPSPLIDAFDLRPARRPGGRHHRRTARTRAPAPGTPPGHGRVLHPLLCRHGAPSRPGRMVPGPLAVRCGAASVRQCAACPCHGACPRVSAYRESRVKPPAAIATGLVALLHVYFLVLEMFLWDRPFGRRAFGLTPEFAAASKTLAANQGLYNGFLAAGLLWGLWLGEAGFGVCLFFLACVVVAGVFGAATVSRKILLVQAFPGTIALALVWLASPR